LAASKQRSAVAIAPPLPKYPKQQRPHGSSLPVCTRASSRRHELRLGRETRISPMDVYRVAFENLDLSSSTDDQPSNVVHDQWYYGLPVLLILRFIADRLLNDHVRRHLIPPYGVAVPRCILRLCLPLV
jgi:hypothetical protein